MKKEIVLPGEAILDYHRGNSGHLIGLQINGSPDEPMDPAIFFRTFNKMKKYEKLALGNCKGRILDVGAGAGCHSLVLAKRHFEVSAVESCESAATVAKERGVKDVRRVPIIEVKDEKFDTILLLMNGFGLGGTVEGTKRMLRHLKSLLSPGGQIIGDSTDILYHLVDAGNPDPGDKHYYGEVEFQLTYKGKSSKPFDWVYFDPVTLENLVKSIGFEFEILYHSRDGQFLVRLS